VFVGVFVGVFVPPGNCTTTPLSSSTILLLLRDGGPSICTRIFLAANSRFIASASSLLVALAALASGSSVNSVGA